MAQSSSLRTNQTNQAAQNSPPPNDGEEARKPARRILEQEIAEGLGEIERPTLGLFIAGLSAGLDIGFSLLFMAVTLTAFADQLPSPWIDLLVANMYAIGYIFVIIGRSELFTEHTTLAVLPVLNRRASILELLHLWLIVYVANLLGVTIFAALVTLIGPALEVIDVTVFDTLATHMVDHQWWVILLSGLLTGWLMGLLSWLVTAGRDTISQIFLIWLVTSGIGFVGLHHAVTGSVEVLAAIFANQSIPWLDYGHFLLWSTLGNAIGGVVFVALIKYSHVFYASTQHDDISLNNESDAA
jgi:formate-nitrite transporter family protein